MVPPEWTEGVRLIWLLRDFAARRGGTGSFVNERREWGRFSGETRDGEVKETPAETAMKGEDRAGAGAGQGFEGEAGRERRSKEADQAALLALWRRARIRLTPCGDLTVSALAVIGVSYCGMGRRVVNGPSGLNRNAMPLNAAGFSRTRSTPHVLRSAG